MKMGRSLDARKAFERYLKLAPTAPDAARIRQKLTEL
jgi:predicted RNA polymerase sigma factor